MFLHLGQWTVIPTGQILGIFDLDNTTVSRHSRDCLTNAQRSGHVVNVSSELPKSYVICQDETGQEIFYLSQLSASTLLKRLESGTFSVS